MTTIGRVKIHWTKKLWIVQLHNSVSKKDHPPWHPRNKQLVASFGSKAHSSYVICSFPSKTNQMKVRLGTFDEWDFLSKVGHIKFRCNTWRWFPKPLDNLQSMVWYIDGSGKAWRHGSSLKNPCGSRISTHQFVLQGWNQMKHENIGTTLHYMGWCIYHINATSNSCNFKNQYTTKTSKPQMEWCISMDQPLANWQISRPAVKCVTPSAATAILLRSGAPRHATWVWENLASQD